MGQEGQSAGGAVGSSGVGHGEGGLHSSHSSQQLSHGVGSGHVGS